MVRFSDIIGTEPKDKDEGPSSEKPIDTEKLWTTDSQIINVKDIPELSDPGSADRPGEKLKEHYDGLLEKATDIRDRVRNNQGITPSPVLSILHQIINDDLIDRLYEYALPIQDDELPSHTIAVTLTSLKVGKGMGYDTEKLLRLGLAAFFENVGMYKIPEALLKKKGKLSPGEIAEIRKHPKVSAKILGQMGQAYQWLAETALQVHERSDGSGYPRGLKGAEISEFASVIGLVDTYVAMIKKRPYRNKFIQTEAVKSIIELDKRKFPPRVIKGFLNQISLFPVNTYVRLNNKSVGRVVSTDMSQPLRPAIELLYDGQGQELEKRNIIRLSESPLLHIIGTVDETKLA